MKYVLPLIFIFTSCSAFHAQQSYEMERLSEDVLSDKKGKGISIQILPIEPTK